jgi:hypothetical protein
MGEVYRSVWDAGASLPIVIVVNWTAELGR